MREYRLLVVIWALMKSNNVCVVAMNRLWTLSNVDRVFIPLVASQK